MTHGKTREEAIQQGYDAIESWIMVAQELGRPVPLPQLVAHTKKRLRHMKHGLSCFICLNLFFV
jgi:hypothetical protein